MGCALPGLQTQRTKELLGEQWGCHATNQEVTWGSPAKETGANSELEDLALLRGVVQPPEDIWSIHVKAGARCPILQKLMPRGSHNSLHRTRDPSRCVCPARSTGKLEGLLHLGQHPRPHGCFNMVGGGGGVFGCHK